jgi:putative oxidoreductase
LGVRFGINQGTVAMNMILELWNKAMTLVKRIEFAGPLLVRICLGVLFAQSGWGKIHNIERTTQFFASLHIPAPGIQAVFVSLVELVGGVCLVVGSGARVAAALLSGTMVVALLTAVEYEGFVGFLTANETIYLVALAWLILSGPGAASLDALVAHKLNPSNAAVRLRDAA